MMSQLRSASWLMSAAALFAAAALPQAGASPVDDDPWFGHVWEGWAFVTLEVHIHNNPWVCTSDSGCRWVADGRPGHAPFVSSDVPEQPGDGDPTNDPPLPFDPDNLGPNPADHCVCVEAAKTNRIKYLQDGTVNWLGWELVSPGTANDWPIWQRVKDPATATGWAEDADGNPMCGRPH